MLFEISGLKVNYGGAEILKGISLKVEQGEVVTLIGSNGAGKTTTLRTVSGLKRPETGEIRFGGMRIDGLPSQDIVRRGIIHVPQGRGLFPYMSVAENLKLGAFLRSDDDAVSAEMAEVLDRFPRLKERGRQLAGTLSGGEQQLLAIACALMGRPKLLLLDEPSSGLSPIAVKEIGKAIAHINESGTSILLVEQNARLALKLAQRGYVLETGSIVLEGRAKDLMGSEHIKRAYLGQ
ncbi:MAG: ABC transporter ATP-binding protein [Syntrophorhabdales bacterium]|jgi:branched-chain amino acid transport system ATP-binding protein